MELDEATVTRIAREFAKLELGDPRRTRRVVEFVTAMARHPQQSLPSALGTEAALEGAYRLLNNENVDFDDLLAEHRDRTVDRARAAGEVLVLHDTTTCTFDHADPREIGYLPTGKAGLFAHVSLVVDARRHRRPLGVLHVEPYWRARKSGRGSRKKHISGKEAASWTNREAERWARGVQECHEQLDGCPAIHVMDREGDKYELFAHMREHDQRFVVRLRGDRRLTAESDGQSLLDVVQNQPISLTREVRIGRRKAPTAPRSRRQTPERPARGATLCVTRAAVVLRRPNSLPLDHVPQLPVHVVHVREMDPPADQEPIDWTLLTSEPIDTLQDIERIIDIYRYRWLIEELFKALKTGCLYEDRHFESRHALLNLLATSLPIAVELLWMRARVEDDPNAPALDIIDADQLEVLRAMGHRPLPVKPTAAQVLLAIAGLGGHLKRNGPPGWLVLHRGYQRLLDYTAGWKARSDRQGQTKA
jgi:Transposase DNA-binding/Transposase DDE domain